VESAKIQALAKLVRYYSLVSSSEAGSGHPSSSLSAADLMTVLMFGGGHAGFFHYDFEKHFIKADVINWRDFTDFGGWTKAREAGKVRLEGRDYVMREGDVVEFKVGV